MALRRGKQLRTAAAAAAAPAVARKEAFFPLDSESLPDVCHHAFGAYLSGGERLAVSLTCKALVTPYGGHIGRLTIKQPGEITGDVGALRRLLARQEGLVTLYVWQRLPVNTVCRALCTGKLAGRQLQYLTFQMRANEKVHDETAAALASVFRAEQPLLPALGALTIEGEWKSRSGGLESFLEALGQGKQAPCLTSLTLDVDRTGLAGGFIMHLLAVALEGRTAAGCAGLASLDLGYGLHWVTGGGEGSEDGQRRLLAALLPSVEHTWCRCPYWEATRGTGMDHDTFIDAIIQHGAPSLQDFHLLPEAVRILPHLPRTLQTLHLCSWDSSDSDSIATLAAAPCARTLTYLCLSELGDGEILSDLAAALVQGRFPALEHLCVDEAYDMTNQDLSSFLSHFTHQTPLSLKVLALQYIRIGDAGVAALTSALQSGRLGARLCDLEVTPLGGVTEMGAKLLRRAMQNAPEYVARLESLTLRIEVGMSFSQATQLVGDVVGACPSLKRLQLHDCSFEGEQVARLKAVAAGGGRRVVVELYEERGNKIEGSD